MLDGQRPQHGGGVHGLPSGRGVGNWRFQPVPAAGSRRGAIRPGARTSRPEAEIAPAGQQGMPGPGSEKPASGGALLFSQSTTAAARVSARATAVAQSSCLPRHATREDVLGAPGAPGDGELPQLERARRTWHAADRRCVRMSGCRAGLPSTVESGLLAQKRPIAPKPKAERPQTGAEFTRWWQRMGLDGPAAPGPSAAQGPSGRSDRGRERGVAARVPGGESCDRRQPGHARVRHDQRHEVRRHGHPGQQVSLQPRTPVVEKRGEAGHRAAPPRNVPVRAVGHEPPFAFGIHQSAMPPT